MASVSTSAPARPRPAPEEARAPAPRRRRDRSRLLLLVPVALLAVIAWDLRWANEDGFIYFRIVDNLLNGHGPVFNVGERVEAYTSPAWLALLTVAGGALAMVDLEYVAVALGVAVSAFGLYAAARAALSLLRQRGGEGLALPLGALVVACVPPFWDYSTSGLETSLVFAWLGGTFWALVALNGRRRQAGAAGIAPRARAGRAVIAVAVLVGLGPLVRPDLALFAAGFMVALVAVAGPLRRRAVAGLLGAAVALPLLYQVFRMGYFAALLPNTALAKEAGLTFWARGLDYLGNFVLTYLLWIPLAVLLVVWGAAVRRDVRSGDRRTAVLAAAPVACAIVHGVYVVKLGGDYMHGRMLLPTAFALVLPVAVVPAGRRLWLVPALAVVPWAAVCAIALRAPAEPGAPGVNAGDIRYLDQRRKQKTTPGHPHPVRLEDHAVLPYPQPYIGTVLRGMAERGRAVVVDSRDDALRPEGVPIPARTPLALAGVEPLPSARARVVAWTGSIGRVGYAAGPEVRLVDRLGLADPLGARVEMLDRKGANAGHEKDLPAEWALARFADPAALARHPVYGDNVRVDEARQALGCPDLRRLIAATNDPLTPRRFLDNVLAAPSLASLRFPADPLLARDELCR